MSMRIVGGSGSWLKMAARVAWTLVLLVLVVLVALAVWVRFESGRDFAMRRLSAAVEMPLTAERTRIVWPYRLEAERVQSVEQASIGVPLLWIRTLRVGRSLDLGWCLEGEALKLVLDEGLAEKDGLFSRLAAWQGDAAGLHMALGRLRVKDRLRLRESSLTWLAADGQPAAFVEGLIFRLAPAKIPEYRLVSVGIDFSRAEGPGLLGSGERSWRWLSGERVPFVDLLRPAAGELASVTASVPPCAPPCDACPCDLSSEAVPAPVPTLPAVPLVEPVAEPVVQPLAEPAPEPVTLDQPAVPATTNQLLEVSL
jgi:hypothetical protein